MTKDYSPFTPGVPVPVDFFIGREQEMREMVSATNKASARKTVERIFIIGERGIGKSSLCRMAMTIAESQSKALGLHVFLGGADTLEEMARRIFERLLRESVNRPWFETVKEFLGQHVRQVGFGGFNVQFTPDAQDLKYLVNNFAESLHNLLNKLKDQYNSLLLILDDINGLSSNDAFANWLKSLVDEIATACEPLPVTLVLVGLPERRQQMIVNQPSLDRFFDLISIQRFSDDETGDFFRRAFRQVGVQVDPSAIKVMSKFSGGYPVLMHEIGDAVYKNDQDSQIDDDDAFVGVFRAADVFALKYIEPKIIAAIRSEKYHFLLTKIPGESYSIRFTRKEIAARLTAGEAKSLDNFLRKMVQLDAIQKDPERSAGTYRFANELLALYFFMNRSGGEAAGLSRHQP